MPNHKDSSHQNHVQEIQASQLAAREAKVDAQANRRYPDRPYIITEGGVTEGQQAQRQAHAAILNYWSDIRPFRQNLTGLWDERLDAFDVPTTQTYHIETNVYGEPTNISSVYRRVETAPRPVNLASLDEYWRTQQFQIVLKDDTTGDVRDVRQHKVYLPVSAIAKVFDQLYDCIEQLNLAAEIDEIPDRDAPPEPPEHVRENAPAYQGDAA